MYMDGAHKCLFVVRGIKMKLKRSADVHDMIVKNKLFCYYVLKMLMCCE